jgi:hypothetical protein
MIYFKVKSWNLLEGTDKNMVNLSQDNLTLNLRHDSENFENEVEVLTT